MSPSAKFFRLSSADRWLVMEAAVWLGLARIIIVSFPFRWTASMLGRQGDASVYQNEMISSAGELTGRVAWSIRRMSRYTPWRSNCLTKAIAARWMLRRRRIASVLHFGMIKGKDGQLMAHAWLKSGDMTLTGGANLNRYSIVAVFTDKK